MGRLLPRILLGLALGLAVFATGLGLLAGSGLPAPAGLALAAGAGACALLCGVAGRRGGLALPAEDSRLRFLLRAAAWSTAAFALLAPVFGVLGGWIVSATWEDPEHSQAGLYALGVALVYGSAWAPFAGLGLAWWRRPAPGGDRG